MSQAGEVRCKSGKLNRVADALLGFEQERAAVWRLAVPARKWPQILRFSRRRKALVDIGIKETTMQGVEAGHLQPAFKLAKSLLPAAMQQLGESDDELHMRIVAVEAAATIERFECFGVAAEGVKRQTAIDVSGAEIGSNRQRAVKRDDGICGSIALDQDRATPSVTLGKIGLEREHALDAGHRLVKSRRFVEQLGVQLPGRKPIRVRCDHPLAVHKRGYAVAFLVQRRSPLELRLRPRRIQRKHTVKAHQRVIELPAVCEQDGSGQERGREVRPHLDRAIATRQRVVPSPQKVQRLAAVQPCFRHVRRQSDRSVVARDRLFVTAELLQHRAPVDQRRHQIGHQLKGAIIGSERFVRALQVLQDIAAIGMRRGEALIARDRIVAACQRVFDAAGLS